MKKQFPRFLFSDPTNVKEKGPYIVHTLEPQFICKLEFDKKRHVIDCRVLEIFDKNFSLLDVWPISKEIPEWYKHSGIHQSSNIEDKVLSEMSKCEFLQNHDEHYTVDEARQVVRILFPSKAKKIYEGSSSYGLKHLLEHVSEVVANVKFSTKKYCSNDTMIAAFEKEGFRMKEAGPNRYMNLLASEVNRAKRLFWNY